MQQHNRTEGKQQRRVEYEVWIFEVKVRTCFFSVHVVERTSWTDLNPGKRLFVSCYKRKASKKVEILFLFNSFFFSKINSYVIAPLRGLLFFVTTKAFEVTLTNRSLVVYFIYDRPSSMWTSWFFFSHCLKFVHFHLPQMINTPRRSALAILWNLEDSDSGFWRKRLREINGLGISNDITLLCFFTCYYCL